MTRRLISFTGLIQALRSTQDLEVFQCSLLLFIQMTQMTLRITVFHHGRLYTVRWTRRHGFGAVGIQTNCSPDTRPCCCGDDVESQLNRLGAPSLALEEDVEWNRGERSLYGARRRRKRSCFVLFYSGDRPEG